MSCFCDTDKFCGADFSLWMPIYYGYTLLFTFYIIDSYELSGVSLSSSSKKPDYAQGVCCILQGK